MLAYLDGVRDHILKNLQRFKGAEAAPVMTPMGPMPGGEPSGDPFLPYRVNVFVDNSDTQGPPIIVETNPTYHNLFGVIEKKPIVGGYVTDFTLIKAGSISRANGGYLVLYDRDVLSNSGVLGSAAAGHQEPRAAHRGARGVLRLCAAPGASSGTDPDRHQSHYDRRSESLSNLGSRGSRFPRDFQSQSRFQL